MDIDHLLGKEEYTWRDILLDIITDLDPWDVDIVALASRYAQVVEEMVEMDFAIPANVVVVCSVLLRMKADIMGNINPSIALQNEFGNDEFFGEFNFESFNQPVFEGNGGNGKAGEPPISLTPKRVPKRRITALELISAIQEVMEDKVAKSKWRESLKKTAVNIKADLDIRKLISNIYDSILKKLGKKESISYSEVACTPDQIADTFIPLLHLWGTQKLDLVQTECYGDIMIKAV